MKRFELPQSPVFSTRAWRPEQVRLGVDKLLTGLESSLPSRHEPLLLKPCLNTDRPALVGGSSDFRLLVALIEALRDRGHRALWIAEAALPPFRRAGVFPWARLRADRLFRAFDLKFIDVATYPTRPLALPTGTVRLSRVIDDVGGVLNLPTLKTHARLGLTGGAANLKGLVHPEDRALLVRDSAKSLVGLSLAVRPCVTLLDALLVMEGEGPLLGTPRRTELLMAAADGLALDLVAARLFGYTPEEVPHLFEALYAQALEPEAQVWVESRVGVLYDLRRPRARRRVERTRELVTGFLHGELEKRAELPGWSALATRLNLHHTVHPQEERLEHLTRAPERCGTCHRCEAVCPVGLARDAIGAVPKDPRCIECLYCLQVCDRQALQVEGSFGATWEHLGPHRRFLEHL